MVRGEPQVGVGRQPQVRRGAACGGTGCTGSRRADNRLYPSGQVLVRSRREHRHLPSEQACTTIGESGDLPDVGRLPWLRSTDGAHTPAAVMIAAVGADLRDPVRRRLVGHPLTGQQDHVADLVALDISLH